MATADRRRVLLAQLPIPPLGPAPIRGNVPLAAGYLKLFAHQQGLGQHFDIQILPAVEANTLGDRALAVAIADREPWLIGFTCYVWNIERTLWLCRELKRLHPAVRIILGGPEITADNAWVLESPDYDYAVIGEGEQTFSELLHLVLDQSRGEARRVGLSLLNAGPNIPGLYVPPTFGPRFDAARQPAFRTPLPDINVLGSPYLAGLLDAADEQMLLLETTRGCVFKCKFCYYPKSYDKQYYLSFDLVRAGLRHAAQRGAREVFLLDPTLNQRKDFADLLRVLAEENPGRQFSYFGELRGEGITEKTAKLLREANFTEVEVGLQSIDPDAMDLMDRKNNLRAFERGVRAMMAEGIRVKVDLIVGLPGDTAESVRRGMHYLKAGNLFDDIQVFNLAVLPGTAFRHEAVELGLKFQPRPPYYVLQTPTLSRADLYGLMHEAQEIFDVEFDAQPSPVLDGLHPDAVWRVDLDEQHDALSPADRRRQAFTAWFRGRDLDSAASEIAGHIERLLAENPFSTLQVVLEPTANDLPNSLPFRLPPRLFEELSRACHSNPTYLDKYYALQPGGLCGAKRLAVLLPGRWRDCISAAWLGDVTANWATVVWSESVPDHSPPSEFSITPALATVNE
ncbi:MAG: B12-binding domain-containing radical SAM protein [Gemmataceae bacterium]